MVRWFRNRQVSNDRLVVALIKRYYFGANLEDFLSLAGFKLLQPTSSEELLDLLSRHDPALVVVDLTQCDVSVLPDIVARSNGSKTLAFGPAHEEKLLNSAVDAGFDEVVLNTYYHRELKSILTRLLPGYVLPEVDRKEKRRSDYLDIPANRDPRGESQF